MAIATRRPRARPWLRLLAIPALAIPVLIGVTALWGLIAARSTPVVRAVTITLAGIPHGTRPLRIALVSDIHVGNWAMPVDRLNRIVDQINAERPDAVLIAGDMVNGGVPESPYFHPELFVAPLSRLRAPLGAFASIGNHDAETDPKLVGAALRRAGVQVLADRAVRVGPIALIGMDSAHLDARQFLPVVESAQNLGGVPVLMTHIPPWPSSMPKDIPLVLSGHTHCGQIVIGPWDNSWDPFRHQKRFDPRFRCGIAHTRTYTVVVTGGLGAASKIPLRINAPPDIWMITLIAQR